MRIAERGYFVYDFALPLLVLHTLYTGSGKALKNWLRICPRKQYTTLDTHDGIGVVDCYDLLTEEEIEAVCAKTKEYGANFKMDFSEKANEKPVVQRLCKLMRFRNEWDVFDGEYVVKDTPDDVLEIVVTDDKKGKGARLRADLKGYQWEISTFGAKSGAKAPGDF